MQRFALVSLPALSPLAIASPSAIALNERFEQERWENLNSFNDNQTVETQEVLQALNERFEQARWENLNS